jgi:hypothetical protein
VQTGSNNLAWCHQRTDSSAADQNCSITQTGKRNLAYINQSVHASDSDTQSATQTAVVDQRSRGSGFLVGNLSFIDQSVKQSTGPSLGDDADEDDNGPVPSSAPSAEQTQDAHQTAEVTQSAEGKGDNYSHVHQSERLSAKNALIQNQNTLGGPDCVGGFPFDPNACADIDQSAEGGNNTSQLKQTIRENAKTHAVASQQQGSFGGGLDAKVHQDTSTGRSRSNADQSKRQDQDAAPGSSQLQYDPVRCCGTASQVGGSGNSEQIDQSSTQAASDANAQQHLAVLGESFSPNGSCSVSQQASNNSASTPNSGEANPCAPPLVLVTTCTSDDGEGSCTPVTVEDGCVTPFCNDFSDLVYAKPNG